MNNGQFNTVKLEVVMREGNIRELMKNGEEIVSIVLADSGKMIDAVLKGVER